jgi:hypothetical protein
LMICDSITRPVLRIRSQDLRSLICRNVTRGLKGYVDARVVIGEANEPGWRLPTQVLFVSLFAVQDQRHPRANPLSLRAVVVVHWPPLLTERPSLFVL